MLPLLGGRLVGAAPDTVPAAFAARVSARLLRDRMENMARHAQVRDVAGALATHGIRSLPLKGPGLAARVHGDIGLRSPGDVDVLVAARDLAAAVGALRGEGYGPAGDIVDRQGLPRLHFTLPHAALPTVELHRRVAWYEDRFSADLLDRARPGADGLLEPDPVDEAASLLLFYARDAFYGVRFAADIGAWWDRHGAAPGAGLLDEYLRRYPELAPTWRAAAAALARVTGLPAATWVGAARRPGRRESLAVRLACWSQRGDTDQLRANQALIDGLLTPAGALDRFAARVASTEPDHVAAHVVKTAARMVGALWAVRREPWDPVPRDA